MIWNLPGKQTYVTTPGSALLFPSLMVPTQVQAAVADVPASAEGDRSALMPRRKTTRAQNRARYRTAERARNRSLRRARHDVLFRPGPAGGSDDDPPPF